MHRPSQLPLIPSKKTLIGRCGWRLGLACVPLALLCLALSPQARAVDPPPEGDYPGGNTAVGKDALFSLRGQGFHNTAVGFEAIFSSVKGDANTAVGYRALYGNTNGSGNTAFGLHALRRNTIGTRNVASGVDALYANTTGSINTAYGWRALISTTTGKNNIGIGAEAGWAITTGFHNIDIGNDGVQGDSHTIRIGDSDQTATFIAGISGVTVADGVGVIIDSNGHLGTVTSSARFKDGITPMDKASEDVLALEPVTFHYRNNLDPDAIPQFGLVAEQVEMVNPALVVRDDQGKPYSVRYEAVNAMVLNEFIKQHRKVQNLERDSRAQAATNEELQSAIAQQREAIQSLTASLKQQASQMHRLSERLAAEPIHRMTHSY